MKSDAKKLIAPIVITVLVVLYYIFYFGIVVSILYGFWKYVFGFVPLALACGMIGVCIERMKEIKEGEEDDLSKY